MYLRCEGSLNEEELVVVDLEGTGADEGPLEEIVEICMLKIRGLHVLDRFFTLVNPGRPVFRKPWLPHGLTTPDLIQAPSWSDIEEQVIERLEGAIVVGHNVRVDWALLHRKLPGVHPRMLLDTLRLARVVHPGRSGHSLSALVSRYQLDAELNPLNLRPHRALYDATATMLVFSALCCNLRESGYPLNELQRVCEISL